MNKLILTCLLALCCVCLGYAQSINDLINRVDANNSLSIKLQEFSGEIPTMVNGSSVLLLNRESDNNNPAADYLKERLMSYPNLSVEEQNYSTNGRYIVATQLGKSNPENIYILCAHYDAVTDYCADDNASGSMAVLEVARILSTQCFDNTIIYAFWDEEENGLVGSNFYATQAANNNDNILGVVNLDMMAYDGDDDDDFDIDVRDFGNSIALKDDIISVLNDPSYSFNLNVNVVNPGTFSSDHTPFWLQDYSAVLVGEAWSNNDQSPFYHTSADRYATLDIPYYKELTKLVLAYMATAGSLEDVDSTINLSGSTLMVAEASASYQWFDCDTNTAISGAIGQSFEPSEDGNYAVEVTSGDCTERSACFAYMSLGNVDVFSNSFSFYPNPVEDVLIIESATIENLTLELYDISGKRVRSVVLSGPQLVFDMKDISEGVYFLKLKSQEHIQHFKIVKN